MADDRVTEKPFRPSSGWVPLQITLVALIAGVILFIVAAALEVVPLVILAVPCAVAGFISLFGFMAIQPNVARVLLLFGKYEGTVSQTGFFWVNPFYSKKKISLRVRNFETGSLATPETKNASGQVMAPKSRTAGHPKSTTAMGIRSTYRRWWYGVW